MSNLKIYMQLKKKESITQRTFIFPISKKKKIAKILHFSYNFND